MENGTGKICPFCKTDIKEGEAVKVCPVCNIPHHEGCWEENKGCTTFGCSEQHYEAQGTNPTAVCSNCGAALGDGQAFCPKCGTPKNAPKKNICGKCGAELQEGQAFCPTCGQKAGLAVDANVTDAINQFNAGVQTKKKKKAGLPIILGVVAVVAVALIFLLKGPSVEEITLSESRIELRVDDSTTVKYSIDPDKASDVEVTWESSDKSVATVNSNGKIVAKGEGTCTITATAGGKSDTVKVTVITLSKEEKMVLGTWDADGYLDDKDKYNDLPASSSKIYFYDDFTGKLTIGSDITKFTWAYEEYDGEDYIYSVELDSGDRTNLIFTELSSGKSLILVLDDYWVVFQK